MSARLRVLGIAAASGRVGYALLDDETLADWGLSRVASKEPAFAAEQTRRWIELLRPEVIAIESMSTRTRKRGRTPALVNAISNAAVDASVLCLSVERRQRYKNKYKEARALARRFPDLEDLVPTPPPIWLTEPRKTILFEALALALEVKRSDDL